jgi:serine/threonine protein kinase
LICEKKIGEGNFREVYCVKNIKTQDKKAMKTMEKKGEGKFIEAELKVGLRIASDYKYLIPVEEFFKESNNYCLIMELCKSDLLFSPNLFFLLLFLFFFPNLLLFYIFFPNLLLFYHSYPFHHHDDRNHFPNKMYFIHYLVFFFIVLYLILLIFFPISFIFLFSFFFFIYFILLFIFNIIFINLEIEFIQPLNDVKIQGKSIIFAKDVGIHQQNL